MHNAVMTKTKRNVFAVSDLGTSKIYTVIVRMHNNSEIEILGHYEMASSGIKSGMITNITQVHQCIAHSVEEAEKTAAETIDNIYITIAGTSMVSEQVNSSVPIYNNTITKNEIRKLSKQSFDNYSGTDTIIHNVPVAYRIDHIEGVTDPIGMCGNTLEAEMHLISISRSNAINLQKCINHCDLTLSGCIAAPYASAISCLTKEDMLLGAILLDIGASSSSFTVFDNNYPIYTGYIPIAGHHITKDLAHAFSIDIVTAEKIKNLHGNLLLTSSDQDTLVDIQYKDETIQLYKAEIVNVIRPRMEEILEMIHDKIAKYKINKRIVLTGGTSQLPSIRELTNHIFDSHVRLGYPMNFECSSQKKT